MFDKILVALDGSELAHRIIPFVRELLLDAPATLDLVRVVGPEELDALTETEARAVARAHLSRVAGVLAERGYRTRTTVLEGDPAEEILAHADETKPDLIALASHGRSGIARWIRGSVAERLLRTSRTPLLVASSVGCCGTPWWGAEHSRALARETGFAKILVPLDGSERANAILPLVAEIARQHGSEVLLLHVAKKGTAGRPAIAFEAALATLAGAHARLRVVEGDPATRILETATDELVDLVALTTHGARGESPWPFGATAEHVLRHCGAPLLVQRTLGATPAEEPRTLASSAGGRARS